MKGLPKRFATADDIRNCHELTKTGEISKPELLEAMENLERQNYLHCGIQSISEDKKTVTVVYCAEAHVNDKAICNGKTVTIKGVNHVPGEEEGTFDATEILLSAKVDADAEIIDIPLPYTIYDQLGMTKEEFDEIKADLMLQDE